MNILLLCPQFPDTFWGFKHALQFSGKRTMFPPLGLITVAAMLPKEWNLRLVDMNVTALAEADLDWADCAMITGMSVQRDSALALIARCKAAGLRVVAGGPLFTVEPEIFPTVDHLVLNEAEITLPRFLADLANGTPQRIYKTEEWSSMEQSPAPLWHLLDLRWYQTMSVQYSRGCPFMCDFCNVTTLFGHKPRVKTPAQLLGELDQLVAAGWDSNVFVVDDNLIGNPRQLKSTLLPAMIEWKKKHPAVMFNTQVSINLADDVKMTEMFAQAGFDTIFIGIETPDDASLKECRKSQNRRRDMVEDVKLLQRAGMEVQAGFIVGFDHDGPDIFQRQIDFIQASGIPTAMVGMLQAPPGTELYERMQKEDRLVGRSSGDNVDGTTNLTPVMGLQALRAGYRRVLRELYAPRNYYQRVRTFLRECGPALFDSPLRREELVAFARAFLRFGILASSRLEYWKLLAWTLWNRPDQLGAAVELAITGYHLRKVSESATTGHDWQMAPPEEHHHHEPLVQLQIGVTSTAAVPH